MKELRGFKICCHEGKDNRTDIQTAAGDPRALRQQSQWIIPALILQEDYKKVLLGFILKPQFTLTQHRPRAAMLQDEKCRKKKSYSSYKRSTKWKMTGWNSSRDSTTSPDTQWQSPAPPFKSFTVCRPALDSPAHLTYSRALSYGWKSKLELRLNLNRL